MENATHSVSHALIRLEGVRGDVQGSFFLTVDWESGGKKKCRQ